MRLEPRLHKGPWRCSLHRRARACQRAGLRLKFNPKTLNSKIISSILLNFPLSQYAPMEFGHFCLKSLGLRILGPQRLCPQRLKKLSERH